MNAPDATREQARQILALLPLLRLWITARVQEAGLANDVSFRQYAALRSILDGATSPGELARLWQVTPAVITGIVDRLERRGMVRREPDPNDRRRLRLALTESGLAASGHVERFLTDDLAAQLATYSASQLAELSRSVDLLRRTFAALDAKAPPLTPPSEDDDMPLWTEEEAEKPSPLEDEDMPRRRTLVGAGM